MNKKSFNKHKISFLSATFFLSAFFAADFSKAQELENPLPTPPSTPGFAGTLSFDAYEYDEHQRAVSKITEAAADCLDNTQEHHKKFLRRWGISPYYGDRSMFGIMKVDEKRAYLQSLGLPAELLEQLEPTSCVGLAYKCLAEGFRSVGHHATWQKIFDYTQANHSDGTALQNALQMLGWKLYYWNPNTRMNEAWDESEKTDDPTNVKRFWGYHTYRYTTVTSANHRYLYNTVDDWETFVNTRRAPKVLRRADFFVGTAHGGYHVFPGSRGEVIEGHSTRDIRDPLTIENSPFAPTARGGGPNGPYRSGLLALPPDRR